MQRIPAGRFALLRALSTCPTFALAPTTQVAKLTALDQAAAEFFGVSIAISGDTAVIGAHQDDGVGQNSGAAYFYERNAGGADNWGDVVELTASDAAPNMARLFGYSVSIAGDTDVVGSYGDPHVEVTGSNAAYVFARNAGGADQWGQLRKLTASPVNVGDAFGSAVSISVDTVVVGAYGCDGVGGSSDSAYVFERNKGGAHAWGQVAQLFASDQLTSDFFGWSAAISDDTIVVGAYGNDDAGSSSGSAYVFERNRGGANQWGQVAKLTASDSGAIAPGTSYFYLVRGDNVCGPGFAGTASNGAERAMHNCP